METPVNRDAKPKIKQSRDKSTTVMIMGSRGKMRSFKISTGLALFAASFLVLYMVSSLLIINGWFNLRSAFSEQSRQVKALENKIEAKTKSLYRSQQTVTLLEEYVENLEKKPAHGKERRKGVAAVVAAAHASQETEEEKDPGKTTGVVDVQDMVIQREGTKVSTYFKVVNQKSEDEPVGGYIHIIAVSRSVDPKHWSYPDEELKDGRPLNFKDGQIFFIHRFKPVHGRFQIPPDEGPPSSINVLVYDNSGNLILEKKYQVDDVA